MNKTGTRALVTGGSGDLGGAICKRLAADGLHVIVHANANQVRAEEVAAEIRKAGGSAEAVAFDVADGEATRAAIEILLEGGPIQVIVNNAGIHDDAPMAGMSASESLADGTARSSPKLSSRILADITAALSLSPGPPVSATQRASSSRRPTSPALHRRATRS